LEELLKYTPLTFLIKKHLAPLSSIGSKKIGEQ